MANFEPIGPLPHFRANRPTIPKEATFFEFLKERKFGNRLRHVITSFDIESHVAHYRNSLYSTEDPDELRSDALEDIMSNIWYNITYDLKEYNKVLSKHVTFTVSYHKGVKYEQFYDDKDFKGFSNWYSSCDSESVIETKDIVDSIKNGKPIMENIWFERGQTPAYSSYTNEFMHIYDNCISNVVPIDNMYFLPHEDNVMILCMRYFLNFHIKSSRSDYSDYSYITSEIQHGGYHVMYVDQDGNLRNGLVCFQGTGTICSFDKWNHKDLQYGNRGTIATEFAVNRMEDAICGGDRNASVQVSMALADMDDGVGYHIRVLFQKDGNIVIDSTPNCQIISFADYKPKYDGNGEDLIELLMSRPGPHHKEFSILKSIGLYYDVVSF